MCKSDQKIKVYSTMCGHAVPDKLIHKDINKLKEYIELSCGDMIEGCAVEITIGCLLMSESEIEKLDELD